jgi:hypothetical protein
MRTLQWMVLVWLVALGAAGSARAQSPQLSLREFASGQIKKGVRSIGFGGDGATWGNYGLVHRDFGTAIVDGGATFYPNGNVFGFTAVGVTSPALSHGLAIYALGLAQTATGIKLDVRDPWFGSAAQAARGDGGNELFAVRVAMPLGAGFSAGVQLTYEVSHFDAVLADERGAIRYRTEWRPSGGLGVAWMLPNERLLIGTRVILNHDWERREGPFGVRQGLYRSYEYRLGASFSPWAGALFDAGGTLLQRYNQISDSGAVFGGANLGFEQAFWRRAFVVRAGVDECELGFGPNCTYTAGFSLKRAPVNLDVAYLFNLGSARIGTLFGTNSHSLLATLTLDYKWLFGARRR